MIDSKNNISVFKLMMIKWKNLFPNISILQFSLIQLNSFPSSNVFVTFYDYE